MSVFVMFVCFPLLVCSLQFSVVCVVGGGRCVLLLFVCVCVVV